MPAPDTTALLELIAQKIPDNYTKEVSPAKLREVLEHIVNFAAQNSGGVTPTPSFTFPITLA